MIEQRRPSKCLAWAQCLQADRKPRRPQLNARCGTELIVQRPGGTVALKAVTEAIKKVQIGTDKTAAELAITRYEKDLQELREKTHQLASADDTSRNMGRAVGVVSALIGGLVLLVGLWIGLLFVLVGGLILKYAYKQSKRESPEEKGLRDQAHQLENLIAEKKQVAKG